MKWSAVTGWACACFANVSLVFVHARHGEDFALYLLLALMAVVSACMAALSKGRQ